MQFVSIGKPSSLYDTSNPDWVPLKRLGGAPESTTVIAEGRYERTLQREEKKKLCEASEPILPYRELRKVSR